jgi:maltose O-acetyltransferase
MQLSGKQKMLAGEAYNSRDPELLERYHFARKLLLEFNHKDSRNLERKSAILKELFGEVEVGVWIEAPFYCDYGENIRIESNVTIGAGSIVTKDIPDNCLALGNPCKVLREI